MNRRIILILATLLISACSGNDIDTVKEGRLEAFPEFTVGQAFDNRKACDSTSWESFEDQRGRAVVEYQCQLKGVPEYYMWKANTAQEQLDKYHELTMNDLRAWIANSDGAIARERSILAEHQEKLAKSERGEILDEPVHLQYLIRGVEAQIARLEKSVPEKAEQMKREEESYQTKSESIKKMVLESQSAEATEYYQWTVLEDGTFYVVAGGLSVKAPGEPEAKDVDYSDVNEPIALLYADKADSFTAFSKQWPTSRYLN